MDVRNCKRCKKLFNYITGQPLCPACKEELETKFQEVKKYLFEHRGATLATVCEECDVEEHQVRQWIREERLEVMSGFDASIVCEVCGAAITSGKYCQKCKMELMSDLNTAGRKPEKKLEPVKRTEHDTKMRFINTGK